MTRTVTRSHFRDRALWIVAVVSALSAACQPKIGDECSTSTNCSATGDRLCDTTQPGGYCTVFNCEPGSCPEEAVCVAFGAEISTLPECATGHGASPYQRTFCMLNCGGQGDCRAGYECVDLGGPNAWGAVLIEAGKSGKVCSVPRSVANNVPDGTLVDGGHSSAVCQGSDAGIAPGSDAGSDSGSDSGAAGAGGSDGVAGAAGEGG